MKQVKQKVGVEVVQKNGVNLKISPVSVKSMMG